MQFEANNNMEIPLQLKDSIKYSCYFEKETTRSVKLSFRQSPEESSIIETRECYPFEYISPYINFREDRDTLKVDKYYIEPLKIGKTKTFLSLGSSTKRLKKDASEPQLKGHLKCASETKDVENCENRKLESSQKESRNDAYIRLNHNARANVLSRFNILRKKHSTVQSVESTKIHILRKEKDTLLIVPDKVYMRPMEHNSFPLVKMRLPPARTLMRKDRKRIKAHPSLLQDNISQVNKFILAKSIVHPFIGIYNFDEVGTLLSALWIARERYCTNDYYTMLINHYIIVGSKKPAPSLISLLETENSSSTNEQSLDRNGSFDEVLRKLVESKFEKAASSEKGKKILSMPRLETLNLPVEELISNYEIKKRALPETFEDVSMSKQS